MALDPKFDRKHWDHGWNGEKLSRELNAIVDDRIRPSPNPMAELRSVVDDLQALGFRVSRSAGNSDDEQEIWMDDDLAVWLHGRFGPRGEIERIDSIEVLWQKM